MYNVDTRDIKIILPYENEETIISRHSSSISFANSLSDLCGLISVGFGIASLFVNSDILVKYSIKERDSLIGLIYESPLDCALNTYDKFFYIGSFIFGLVGLIPFISKYTFVDSNGHIINPQIIVQSDFLGYVEPDANSCIDDNILPIEGNFDLNDDLISSS
jgi:hypothetical protein